MSDGKVTIETALDSSGFEEGLKLLGGALAALGLGAIAKDIVETGASFESTMSKVGAISGATEQQMNDLTYAAKEMGRTSVFSASESAQAMVYMGMAGWDAEKMIAGLPGIMNLAAASGEDLALVSDICTDALTAFGMQASDSEHFANLLATASSSANTNVSLLGESFKYAAPVVGSLGMSADDATVALALMANAGIKGSQAGTALRTSLTNMVKPSKQMREAMDDLGLSITDEKGNTKELLPLLDEMRDKFGDLSEAEKAEYAAKIFGKEAMSGMLAIINASEEDYETLIENIEGADEAFDGMGSAAGMAGQMVDNFDGQMTLMQSALEGAKLAIWDNIQQPLTDLAKVGTDAITKLTDAFVQDGVPGLAAAAQEMFNSFTNKAISMIPSIVSTGGQLISNLIQGIQSSFPTIITKAAEAIHAFATGIGQQLPTLIPQGLQMLVTVGQSIIDNLPTIIDAGINIVKGIVEGIINSIPILVSQVPVLINNFWDAFDEGLFQIIQAGANLIVKLGQGIVQNIPLIIANAGEIVKAIFNTIMHLDLINAGKNLIKNLASGIKNMVPTAQSTMKDLGSKALDAIKNIDWVGLGKNVITFIKNGISGAGSLLTSGLKTIGTQGLNIFKSIDWLGLGRTVLTAVINGIKALGSSLSSGLKTLGTNAWNAFKGINWLSVGKAAVQGIISGVTGAASGLLSKMKSLASSALSAAKSALGIKSPSRKFRYEVGNMIPRGAAVGVEEDAHLLSESIEEMSEDSIDVASDMADELSEAMIPSRPDLSGYYGSLKDMLFTSQADMPTIGAARSGVDLSYQVETGSMAEMISDMREELIAMKEEIKTLAEDTVDAIQNMEVTIDRKKAGKILAPEIDEILGIT